MDISQTVAQENLGKIIRSHRTQRGYSQQVLAAMCGVHRTYLGSIERGERNIAMANILKIADALGLKASELLALAEL